LIVQYAIDQISPPYMYLCFVLLDLIPSYSHTLEPKNLQDEFPTCFSHGSVHIFTILPSPMHHLIPPLTIGIPLVYHWSTNGIYHWPIRVCHLSMLLYKCFIWYIFL